MFMTVHEYACMCMNVYKCAWCVYECTWMGLNVFANVFSDARRGKAQIPVRQWSMAYYALFSRIFASEIWHYCVDFFLLQEYRVCEYFIKSSTGESENIGQVIKHGPEVVCGLIRINVEIWLATPSHRWLSIRFVTISACSLILKNYLICLLLYLIMRIVIFNHAHSDIYRNYKNL